MYNAFTTKRVKLSVERAYAHAPELLQNRISLDYYLNNLPILGKKIMFKKYIMGIIINYLYEHCKNIHTKNKSHLSIVSFYHELVKNGMYDSIFIFFLVFCEDDLKNYLLNEKVF